MQSQTPGALAAPARKTAASFGFYVAILTAALTAVTFVIAFLTPPLSGPSCVADTCYEYPFADIASRFPRDYYWMYPAMVMALVYLALMACIHHYADEGRKPFSQIGLVFAVIAAGILVVNYFVQVSVIPPSLENGETDGIALLTQFNPHGLFIALEEVGYLLMGASFLFVAPVFTGDTRIEQALRWVLALGFVLAIVALVGMTIAYGIEREYRFEIAVISIDFIVLIVAGILLSVVFRRARDSR